MYTEKKMYDRSICFACEIQGKEGAPATMFCYFGNGIWGGVCDKHAEIEREAMGRQPRDPKSFYCPHCSTEKPGYSLVTQGGSVVDSRAPMVQTLIYSCCRTIASVTLVQIEIVR